MSFHHIYYLPKCYLQLSMIRAYNPETQLKKAAQTFSCVFFDIDSVNQNFAIVNIIQTAKQLNKSRFATAVSADYGKLFAVTDFQVNVLKGIIIALWVFKRNIIEFNLNPSDVSSSRLP